MLLGKVVGTVVATRKVATIDGLKLLLVRAVDEQGQTTGARVVAADVVGAGVDEYVLVASGSSARQTEMTHERPCDAVIMAIVDSWDVDGEIRYRKAD